jgi:hypothetical protein
MPYFDARRGFFDYWSHVYSIVAAKKLGERGYLCGWISDSARDQGSLPGQPKLCRSAERKVRDGLEYLQDAETGRHSSDRHLQSRALH